SRAGSVLVTRDHRHPYEALRDGAHVSTMWGVGGDIGAAGAGVKRLLKLAFIDQQLPTCRKAVSRTSFIDIYRLTMRRIGLIECRYRPYWRTTMTQTASRPTAALLAAVLAITLWLPTVTVPAQAAPSAPLVLQLS
ncbi:MAG: hypothetical protein ABW194_06505, partial [Novosphingobium sp.]